MAVDQLPSMAYASVCTLKSPFNIGFIRTVMFMHAAVSMNPSAGVVQQMAEEARAAVDLGLAWDVWLCQASDLGPKGTRLPVVFRYALLRIRFYLRLIRLAREGRTIVLRYSPGDPFLYLTSPLLGRYFTVHHTMEEKELACSRLPYAAIQLGLERLLGRRVIARARGIICLTPEIAQHELGRLRSRTDRLVLIYPNGVLYPATGAVLADRRGDRAEIAFVASYFFDWHGLERLLDSMGSSDEDGILHLVGTIPDAVRRRANADPRIRIHGQLGRSSLAPLIAQCWLGLSSFNLLNKGMTEACTLKVRDYLSAGLPVYAGHRDSALPPDFKYFRQGPPDWQRILEYAHAMRQVPRTEIAREAQPLIDKKALLNQLHRSIRG